jgi:hypothetical protein
MDELTLFNLMVPNVRATRRLTKEVCRVALVQHRLFNLFILKIISSFITTNHLSIYRYPIHFFWFELDKSNPVKTKNK